MNMKLIINGSDETLRLLVTRIQGLLLEASAIAEMFPIQKEKNLLTEDFPSLKELTLQVGKILGVKWRVNLLGSRLVD